MDNMDHRTSLQGSVVGGQTISARQKLYYEIINTYITLKGANKVM